MMSDTAVAHGSEDVAPLMKSSSSSSPDPAVELQRLGSILAVYRERISLNTLRPLPVFFGLTGPSFCISAQAFAPPTKRMDKDAAEKIGSRLRKNFAYFLSNYALIAAGTTVVVALMHPAMLVLMGICYGLWHLHFMIERAEIPTVVGGFDLADVFSTSRRSYALTVITILVGVFKCLVPLLQVLVISGLAVLVHAAMRDPQHVGSEKRRRSATDSDEEEEYIMGENDTGIGNGSGKSDRGGDLIRRDVV